MRNTLLAVLALTVVMFGQSGAAQEPQGRVKIILTQPWTDTGLYFTQGQGITITARGVMDWGTNNCNPIFQGNCDSTPVGRPWSVCESYGQDFTAPGLACWSLIGKIGENGVPFQVGAGVYVNAQSSGELFLGVNDDYFVDNTGSWGADVNGPIKLLGPTCDGQDKAVQSNAADASQNINSTGHASCGAPVEIATGNTYYEVTDYTTAGPNPLAFTRSYNSQGSSTGMLGGNWSTTYDRRIQILSSSVVLAVRPNGRQLMFTLSGSTWTADSDVDVSLTNSGPNWTLTNHGDTVETYTITVAGDQALLNTIATRNGYTQTMAYNASSQLTSVTDSYGRTLTFTYNNLQLATLTTPENNTFTYYYDGNLMLFAVVSPVDQGGYTYAYFYQGGALPFALSAIWDRYGDQINAWTYDSSARALSSLQGNSGLNANLTTLTYNANGTTTVTNPLGVQDTYTFTTLQNVPKVTQVNRAATGTTQAATRSFAYDGNGYMSSQTDWNGNRTIYVNDSHGDPTTVTEAEGSPVQRTTTITYDSTFVHLPASIATPGLTVNYDYDGSGNLITKTLTDTSSLSKRHRPNGQMRTWTYTWSNFLPVSVKTPNGNTTTFNYDATGALTSIVNALNQTTSVTAHTAGGYPQTVMDPNGVSTTLAYDAQMRLTSSTLHTSAGPLTTQFSYWFEDKIASTTLPDGSVWSNTFDSALRLIENADVYQDNIQYTLDRLGDRTQVNTYDSTHTIHRQHSATFDALGRMLTDVGGVGQTTTYTYDNNGNALTITNPLSHTTTQVFDALNRLSQSTDATNGVTQITYDAHDRPLTVTDPNGGQTAYAYDGFGDVIQQVSPDSGTTSYSYDLDGNLLQRQAATGAVTQYAYDPLDRVSSTTYPADPTENVAYTYDQARHGFGIGRLTSVSDAAGSLSRSCDERGNVTQETRNIGSVGLGMYYTYDAASRIARITYPSKWQASYSRDNAGRVTAITAKQLIAKAVPPPVTIPVVSNVTYKPFGPVTGLTFGNNIADSRSFDLDYRLNNLADVGTGNIQNLTYGYDLDDNVKTIMDAVNPGNSQSFGYDVLTRLSAASGGYGNYSWTYNKVNSRLTETLGGVTTNYGYGTHNNQLLTLSLNGVVTQTIGYTADGNTNSFNPGIMSPGGQLITGLSYNQAAQLGAVMSGGEALGQYTYDAFGQRLIKTLSGSAGALYQHDFDGHLLEEADAHGVAQADYIYLNGAPVATISPSAKTVYFLHDDRLGTPQLATDSAQQTAWSATYLPFGGTSSLQGLITQNLRFPGQHFDSESGWNHNGFRDYAQGWGRYLETDPIGLGGGLNTYVYAGSNPVNAVDRQGRSWYGNWYDFEIDANEFEINALQTLAGFTDSLPFSYSSQARKGLGTDYANPCSFAYQLGKWSSLLGNLAGDVRTLATMTPKLSVLTVGKTRRIYGGQRGAWSRWEVGSWWAEFTNSLLGVAGTPKEAFDALSDNDKCKCQSH